MVTRRDLILGTLKTLVAGPLLLGVKLPPAVARPREPFTLPKHFTVEGVDFTLGNAHPITPPGQRVYVWQYFSDQYEVDGCGFYQTICCLPEEAKHPDVLRAKFEIAKLSLGRTIPEHREQCNLRPGLWGND